MHCGESGAVGLSWRQQKNILSSILSSSSGPMVVRRDGSNVPSSRSLSSVSTSPVVLQCSGTSGRSPSSRNSTNSERCGDVCKDRESYIKMLKLPNRGGNSTSISTVETESHHNESEQVVQSAAPSNRTQGEEEKKIKEPVAQSAPLVPVQEETQKEQSTPMVEKTTQRESPKQVSTTSHGIKQSSSTAVVTKKKRFFRKKKERFVRPDSSAALYSKKLKASLSHCLFLKRHV